MIENEEVGVNRCGRARNFFQLATADERCGIGTLPALQKFSCDLRSRAAGQLTEFLQRFFGAKFRLPDAAG